MKAFLINKSRLPIYIKSGKAVLLYALCFTAFLLLSWQRAESDS